MARKLRVWKKLICATLVGAFWTTPAVSHVQNTVHKTKTTIPDPDDSHWLVVENDSDGDFLSDLEEIALGYDEENRDMNANWWADGVELGRHYHRLIGNLPWWNTVDPEPSVIYKIDYSQYGLEQCEICGEMINMGFARIVNPQTQEEIDVNYIALHYMNHGSFSYDGTIHDGRVDPVMLANVLHDAHLIPVADDDDADYLSNGEESAIGYQSDNPDENGNWVRDGAELAAGMAGIIAGLPQGPLPDQIYRIDYSQYGIEFCGVCGESVNMGYVEIHNPILGTSTQIDFIALHAMEHESFDFEGSIHQGRVDLATLKQILEGE